MHTILQASIADVPEVMAFYRSLIGTPGCIWNEMYPFTELAEQDAAQGALFILRDTDRLIASITVEAPEEDFAALDWTVRNPCELARLGVAVDYQGQGIGNLMLQYALQVARERGFGGAILLVHHTLDAAISLYRKNGFVFCGSVFMYERDWDRYELDFEA